MRQRKPKDIDQFVRPLTAGLRLIGVALRFITSLPDGVRVRWELRLRTYWPEEELKKVQGPCVAMGGTFRSGDEDSASSDEILNSVPASLRVAITRGR